MNYNQQIQGYNCKGCLKLFSFNGVKQYCLDNNHFKMYCVLCPTCEYNQYSSRERTGVFPLLAGVYNNNGVNEIRTPEFIRHEEVEIKFQQEQRRNQIPSQFNCDKCQQAIPFGGEREHEMFRYEKDPALIGVVSEVKYRLLCLSCYGKSSNQFILGVKTDFTWAKKELYPNFKKFQEYKEKVNQSIKQSNPKNAKELEKVLEEDFQERLKNKKVI